MHAVVRVYSGTGGRELLEFIAANKAEIDVLLRAVPGFRSYAIAPQGGFTVTMSDSEQASAAVTEAARSWVLKAAAHIKADAPTIMGGAVAWQLS